MEHTTDRKAYQVINIIFAGVILLIMGYSVFYSPYENKYPVVCIHEKLTGLPCPSCGMSHAFSLIVRGRTEEALIWNSLSVRVFLFFAVQLLLRILLGAWSFITGRGLKYVYRVDAIISSIMTLAAFYPFLKILWLTLKL